MISYKELAVCDMDLSLFAFFDRTQIVNQCWRKVEGQWKILDVPFVDHWSEEEYRQEIQYLQNLICGDGYVVGGFVDGHLKGFASVEPALFGTCVKYMDLSNIHVSRDMRGGGMGRALFNLAKRWAKDHGAEKLYISAHSAVESQAFYKAMGCVEASEYNEELAQKEPCDCQLECLL
ncbi:MAG: GNAT family N-acetyltransferase [Eubacteriales bacterium]|nr:GNAT family N-acetyltransferase [Eubacteriales bacterium]